MARRAAIYLRQSLDRGEGIESQRKRCTMLAESRNWSIVAAFNDNETRASKPRGPETGWGRMLQRVGKDFEVIVAVDLDRLLRSTKDLNTLIDLGAQVITVDGEIDLASADGEFRATMLAGIGRFETRRASERQKRNKTDKAERGEWHGGTPPYGYCAKKGKLEPSPTEVERIHEVTRRMLDDRESMHSIVTDWNNKDFPTRAGKHWRQANLRSIMLNRSMLGETKAGVVGWEPIVEKRTFDRMTALLTDPSRKVVHSPGLRSKKYAMGGGLTVCGVCGKALITHGKVSSGSRTTTLACLARVHGPSDKHPRVERERMRNGTLAKVLEDTGRVSISHAPLEEVVFEALIAKLEATPRFLKRMGEQDPETDNRLDELEQERRDLRDEKERAQNAYVKGIMDERKALAEVQRVDTLIDAISEEYDSLLRLPISISDFDPDSGIDWRSWTAGRRRAALLGFISRVEVQPYPAGAKRTRPRFKNESVEDYETARWSILKEAAESRIKIVWKWESDSKPAA